MVQKQVKKAMKKKKKHTEELRVFEKISVPNSDQESFNSSSSEEGEIWKLDSVELFRFNNNHSSEKVKEHTESFLNLDDCINANYNYESLRSRLVSHSNSNKNYKKFTSSMQEDLVPIIFGELIPEDKIRKNNSKNMSVSQNYVRSNSMYVKILMNSGASASIIHDLVVRRNKFNTRKTSANNWSTIAGSFPTSCEAEVKVKLPELNFTAHTFPPIYVTSQKSNYNVINGQDLLRELGINLDFQNNFVCWKETKIPMKSNNYKMRTNFAFQESKFIKSAINRIKKIWDANYEKANLKEITNKLKYLNSDK